MYHGGESKPAYENIYIILKDTDFKDVLQHGTDSVMHFLVTLSFSLSFSVFRIHICSLFLSDNAHFFYAV